VKEVLKLSICARIPKRWFDRDNEKEKLLDPRKKRDDDPKETILKRQSQRDSPK